jgi:hypothetical protein
MDILNWVYLLKNKLVKTTVQDPTQDLVILGNNVSYVKRGDKYQSYGMTVEDFATYIGSTIPSAELLLYSSPTPFNNNVTTGAAITQVAVIPANTLPDGPFTLEIVGQTRRHPASGAGTFTSLIYTNTSYGLVGASLLATCNLLTGTQLFGSFARTFNYDGTTLNGTAAAVQTPSDYTSNAGTTTAFDPTVDNYIMFATNNTVPGLVSQISAVRILTY